ncbi:hypothetical protein [Paractinoplanes maris]|uniref:hypothetical protein n=1 Tax=Paractinoplanes maris TaxID=1734446 RepID=UPI0020219927|nr:hypothetical protein [Actinoplanes maris]
MDVRWPDGLDVTALTADGWQPKRFNQFVVKIHSRECAIHEVCGAGNYTHRFHEDTGFLNPSVYCADLALFIGHIQDRVSGELATIRTRRPPGADRD